MTPMLKVSAAAFVAALIIVPAAYAATGATMVAGTKTDLAPVATVSAMVGTWKPADLSALDKASSVTVYDTKSLYPAADQTKIAAAQTAHSSDLGKFHTAIMADATLKGWLATNNIDVSRVVAISDPSGKAEIFLY